jgi:hypothetical protein
LFASHPGSGGQQLPQQPLRLVELRGYIDKHLPQNRRILRQTVGVDGHLLEL